MKRAELVAALLFLAFSAVFWISTGSLPGATNGEVGPAYFPRLVAVLLAGLTVLLLIDVVRHWNDDRRPFPMVPGSLLRLLIALVLTAAYGMTLNWLGYLLGTFLYAVGLFMTLKVKPLWAVLSALAAVLVIWAGFQVGLHVPLPQGAFF